MAYVPKGRPRGRPTKAEAALRAFSPLALKPYRIGSAPPLPPPPGFPGSFFTSNPFPMPDLLRPDEVAGMLQLGLPATMRFIEKHLPEHAVVRINKRARVHSWAIAHILKMTNACPGCGRGWSWKE